jgi:hypothetical protein
MVRRLLRMVPETYPEREGGQEVGFPEDIMRDFKIRQA